MANSYKTVLKKIILKLGFGFKKDRVEACLGEEIPLQLDEKLFEGNVKNSKKNNRKNSFARWSKEDGSEITDSKTIHDDSGTTYTRSDETSYLMHQVENLSNKSFFDAVYEAVVQSLGGNPIYRLIRRGKQVWTLYSEKVDNSFRISGVNEEDPTQKGDFFQITTRGAVKHLNQPQGLIVLETTTGNVIGNNNWYRLGSKETWTMIFDNYKIFTSLGGSANNPLKAIINERGTFQFKVGMLLRSPGRPTTLQFRILTKGREYFSFGSIPQGLTDGYLSDNIGVIADDNDELYFEIWGGISGPAIQVRVDGTKWPILYTGIFYYLMG